MPSLCATNELTTRNSCDNIVVEMEALKIYTDGARRGSPKAPGEASSAFYIPDMDYKQGKYIGARTNNEAEYEALIMALQFALCHTDWKYVEVVTDSQLVQRQMTGEYRVNEGTLVRPLWEKAYELSLEFQGFEIKHIRGHRKGINDSVEDQDANAVVDEECNRVLDEVQGKVSK